MSVKSVNNSSQVFLNYDFDSSAKTTRKALAVIETKDGNKSVKQLTCVDLNEIGLWKMIEFWWNESLKLTSIVACVDTIPMPKDIKQRANIEKQLAKLNKKVMRSSSCSKSFKAAYRPRGQWDLNVVVRYPSSVNDDVGNADSRKEEKTFKLSFDRLTKNQNIYKHIHGMRGTIIYERASNQKINHSAVRMAQRDVRFGTLLLDVFKKHNYQGDYIGDASDTPYLQNCEMGAHRSVYITLEDFKGFPKSQTHQQWDHSCVGSG